MKHKLLASTILTSGLLLAGSCFATDVVKINFSNPTHTLYLDMAINGKDMATYGASAQKVTPKADDFSVGMRSQDIKRALSKNFLKLNATNTITFYQCTTSTCNAQVGKQLPANATFALSLSGKKYIANPSHFKLKFNS